MKLPCIVVIALMTQVGSAGCGDGQLRGGAGSEATTLEALGAGTLGSACQRDADCRVGTTCECADRVCWSRVCRASRCPACTFATGVSSTSEGSCSGALMASIDPRGSCAKGTFCDGRGHCAGAANAAERCTTDGECGPGRVCACGNATCFVRRCNAAQCTGCKFTAGGGGCNFGDIAAGLDPHDACVGVLACNGSGGCQVADGEVCATEGAVVAGPIEQSRRRQGESRRQSSSSSTICPRRGEAGVEARDRQ